MGLESWPHSPGCQRLQCHLKAPRGGGGGESASKLTHTALGRPQSLTLWGFSTAQLGSLRQSSRGRERAHAQVGGHSPFILNHGDDVPSFLLLSVLQKPVHQSRPRGAGCIQGHVPGGRIIGGCLGGFPHRGHRPERWGGDRGSPKHGLSGLSFLSCPRDAVLLESTEKGTPRPPEE